MDNSHLTGPSPEWLAYAASNPHLDINNITPDTLTPVALRSAANAAKVASVRARLVQTGLDRRVAVANHQVPTRDGSDVLPLRTYRSLHGQSASEVPAAFVYFHGGGMLLGTPDTEDVVCSTWADLLGADVVVLSVCYRHAPETEFPAQAEDAWDAFEWVLDHAGPLGVDPERVVVGGISSGGNLAARVCLREVAERGESGARIKGHVLAMPWLVHRDVYPLGKWFGKRRAKCSLVQCRGAPIMPAGRYDLFTDLVGEKAREEFSVGLVEEDRLRGMPKTAVIACGWDILRDEAMVFAEGLEKVGTLTKKHVFPGLPHSFTKYPDLPSSKRFDELMAESIQWCLSDNPAADILGKWAIEIPEVPAERGEVLKRPCRYGVYGLIPFLKEKWRSAFF